VRKFAIFALLGLVLVVNGCTVVPKIQDNGTAAYDGNEKNSGIIGVLSNGDFLVDDFFNATYAGLIKDYPNAFVVKLNPGDGMTALSGTTFQIKNPHRTAQNSAQYVAYAAEAGKTYYSIDDEHMTKYLDMCDWLNNGITPPTP
jgi:hypothetical protein